MKSDRPLFREVWRSVTATYDAAEQFLAPHEQSVVNRVNSIFGPIVPLDSDTVVRESSPSRPRRRMFQSSLRGHGVSSDDRPVRRNFDGKIDSPKVYSRALAEDETTRLASGESAAPRDLPASWDFAAASGRMGSQLTVVDVSGRGLDGTCMDQPDRGTTAWNWQGSRERFIHAPEQYGNLVPRRLA